MAAAKVDPGTTALLNQTMSSELPPTEHREGLPSSPDEIAALWSKVMRNSKLSCSPEDVLAVKQVSLGWNNVVHLLDAAGGQHYAVRLSHIHWDEEKLVDELRGLEFLPSLLPQYAARLPKVVASDLSGDLGVRVTVFKAVAGTCLVNIWSSLDSSTKASYLDEILTFLASLQKIRNNHPGHIAEAPREEGAWLTKPQWDRKDWWKTVTSVTEYHRLRLQWAIDTCITKQSLKNLHKYLPRAQAVADQLDSFGLDEGSSFCLMHGDIDLRNFMVDPETNQITGFLDWEWMGFYAVEEEYDDMFDEVIEAGDKALLEAAYARSKELSHPNNMANFPVRMAVMKLRDELVPWMMSEDVVPIIEDSLETLETALKHL